VFESKYNNNNFDNTKAKESNHNYDGINSHKAYTTPFKANPIPNFNIHTSEQDKMNTNINNNHIPKKILFPKFSLIIKGKEKIFEIKKSKIKNTNNFSKFLQITKTSKNSIAWNNLNNPQISKINNILESPNLKILKRPFNLDSFSYANERTIPDYNENKEFSIIEKLSINPEYRKTFLENISFNFDFDEEDLIDSSLKQKSVNFDVDVRSIDEIYDNINDLW